MRRPTSAAPAALALTLVLALGIAAAPPSPADRARALLARGDARSAASLLENALPEAPTADRPALRDDLRRAYTLAARQARTAGLSAEAQGYLDNLAILDRKSPASKPAAPPTPEPEPEAAAKPKTTPEPKPTPELPSAASEPVAAPRPLAIAPAPTEPAPIAPPEPDAPPARRPPDEPEPTPAPVSTEPITPSPSASVPALPEPEALPPPTAAPRTATVPPVAAAPNPPTPEAVSDPLAPADAAFRDGHYAEAGRVYAALDRAGQLPAGRRDHWAYCRMVEVVRKINAQPATPAEWSALHAEIARIRALSPRNWFGEYLRNLVVQRSGPPRPADPRVVTLRGAAPEEAPAPPPSPRRPAAAPITPRPAPPAQLALAPNPGPPNESRWQVRRTANFTIFHTDPELAERVATVAEAARETQGRRFGLGTDPKTPRPAWVPRCDIYLYPTPATFAHATGEPEESPGISRMGQDGGRIVSRQVHLRADHPTVTDAVLPHEITHVVLADLFPHKPLPRWADEGLAVLAEPAAERLHRAQDLVDPLTTGRLFRVEELVALDGPEGADWPLYYAQSVSLTRYFLSKGTTEQFIAFLQAAERGSFEAELRRHYQITGTADLHKQWLAHARSTAPAAAVAADDSPSRTRR